MDNRPIGFFDSGLGGLTCIASVSRRLPHEDIIYFGDTARTPYGSKSVKTIQRFSAEICDFLLQKNVKMIVIACNSVSATSLDFLREKYKDLPIVGIIESAAEKAIDDAKEGNKIGIIGTKATISSMAYKNIIEQSVEGADVAQKACPAFVPLIEEGIIENDIMNLSVKYYLDHFIAENRINTLVLGCTHYPFIANNIKRNYPNLKLIDPSDEVSRQIEKILKKKDIVACKDGNKQFYASDVSDNFIRMVQEISEDTNIAINIKDLAI